jgi:hypothetical protein
VYTWNDSSGNVVQHIGKLTGWTMLGQEAARRCLFLILKGPTRVWPCTNSLAPTREDEGTHEIPRIAEPFWLALKAKKYQ